MRQHQDTKKRTDLLHLTSVKNRLVLMYPGTKVTIRTLRLKPIKINSLKYPDNPNIMKAGEELLILRLVHLMLRNNSHPRTLYLKVRDKNRATPLIRHHVLLRKSIILLLSSDKLADNNILVYLQQRILIKVKIVSHQSNLMLRNHCEMMLLKLNLKLKRKQNEIAN